MSDEDAQKAKGLKGKVGERMRPPASKLSQYQDLALDTLAALLHSEDESIRLQAARALLERKAPSAPDKPAAGLVRKLAGIRPKS